MPIYMGEKDSSFFFVSRALLAKALNSFLVVVKVSGEGPLRRPECLAARTRAPGQPCRSPAKITARPRSQPAYRECQILDEAPRRLSACQSLSAAIHSLGLQRSLASARSHGITLPALASVACSDLPPSLFVSATPTSGLLESMTTSPLAILLLVCAALNSAGAFSPTKGNAFDDTVTSSLLSAAITLVTSPISQVQVSVPSVLSGFAQMSLMSGEGLLKS